MSTFKTGNDLKRKYIRTAISYSNDNDEIAGQKSSKFEDKMFVDDYSDLEDEEPDVKKLDVSRHKTSFVRVEPEEPAGDNRPNLSYGCLIALAIQNSPEQKLTLSEIYTAIQDMFPYYRRIDKTGWQNSIRHNLSLNKAFVRKGESVGRAGSYWTIDPVVSIGSFKKIRNVGSGRTPGSAQKKMTEISNQVSTQTNESFWEPDPDIFNDSQSSSGDVPASSTLAAASVTKSVSTQIDMRQSIEEFLEMGLGQTPEKRKVKILSAIDVPQTQTLTAPQPSSTSTVTETLTSVAADDKNRAPFMGSIDFYEQYDPDEALDNGQVLITTEKLPIEWLCFLCGSAGREEMVFCRQCCEPFHPFCLVRFSVF